MFVQANIPGGGRSRVCGIMVELSRRADTPKSWMTRRHEMCWILYIRLDFSSGIKGCERDFFSSGKILLGSQGDKCFFFVVRVVCACLDTFVARRFSYAFPSPLQVSVQPTMIFTRFAVRCLGFFFV